MSTANNTHLIVLSVGDSDCGDGHGMNRKFYILTNVDSYQLKEAYAAGVKVLGLDIEKLTQECDDRSIGASHAAKLEESGFAVGKFLEESYPPRKGFDVDATGYVHIFMHTAAHGSHVLQGSPSEISWEFTQVDKLDIGGYGVVGP